jgi:hypothetical protein
VALPPRLPIVSVLLELVDIVDQMRKDNDERAEKNQSQV